MGQQPRPSQHKKKKTEERGGGTLISEEVGQVSYRTAFLLTPDEQQRPQPPSFITPLATSSKAPRTEAPASSGPLTEKQNLRHDHRPLDLHFYKVPRRFLCTLKFEKHWTRSQNPSVLAQLLPSNCCVIVWGLLTSLGAGDILPGLRASEPCFSLMGSSVFKSDHPSPSRWRSVRAFANK